MGGLIVAALFFVVFWLLVIMPNQRRMRAHQALLAALEVDDEVMTSSGLYGRIVEIDGDLTRVELAPGIVVRMARGAIARRTGERDAPDPDADPGDDGVGDTTGFES